MNLAFKPDLAKINKIKENNSFVQKEFKKEKKKYRKWKNTDLKAIEDLRLVGETYKDIAKHLSTSTNMVATLIEKNGIANKVKERRKGIIEQITKGLKKDE